VSSPLIPASRERIIERLQRHFANDELTEAELESRLKEVYAARTVSDLENIVVDLPLATAPRTDTSITATLSGQERKLAGAVPHELALNARMGYVELDLRDATFAPGVTTIDVRSFMGYVEIHLPEGVRVESHGRALFGYFAVKGLDEDSDRVVRITGRAVFGYAEVFLPDAEVVEEEEE
jgi:Domain of unknown function (DUF1707)/Cell wall-active antibiotics response 4TMS YvqF